MASNYTQEQVEVMIAWYTAEPTRETVEKLSQEFGKSIKSIIGKLSREGVYQKAVYKTKTGEIPITKAQIVENLAELLEIPSNKIMGLEKAPKQDIKFLHDTLGGRING